MSLLKKKLNITIGNEKYVMMFDMKSLAIYKELTEESFSIGYLKLQVFDEEATLNFIACTLRKKEEPNEPLGKKFLDDGNILLGLITLSADVLNYVNMSLPEIKKEKK